MSQILIGNILKINLIGMTNYYNVLQPIICSFLTILLKILKAINWKQNKGQSDPYLWQKPQSLSTPSDFSEYTITNFPGYETQQ